MMKTAKNKIPDYQVIYGYADLIGELAIDNIDGCSEWKCYSIIATFYF